MKRLCVITVLAAWGAVLAASERAVVTIRCPLDGTEFQAVQEFSGFAAGQRLDLKKLGPISQPRPLPRCPDCSLPVWEKYPDEGLLIRLREALLSEHYRKEGRGAPAWYALGVLREELQADPYEIAWTYLQASWEAEDLERPKLYAQSAAQSILWFDRAAAVLAGQADRRRDYHTALYLPVELARRTGDFAAAGRRLEALPADIFSQDPWLRTAIATEQRLIAAGIPTADDQLPEPLPRASPP